MKSKLTLILSLILMVCFSSAVVGYDADLAQSYAKLFQPVAGAKAGKALHLVTPVDPENRSLLILLHISGR